MNQEVNRLSDIAQGAAEARAKDDRQRGLAFKLAEVMAEIGTIPKDGRHEQGWSYHSTTQVLNAIRPALARRNVIIVPTAMRTEQEATKTSKGTPPMTRSTAFVEYVAIDGDTGQTQVLAGVGESMDGNDRGIGQALTFAHKAMLMQTFLLAEPDGSPPPGRNGGNQGQGDSNLATPLQAKAIYDCLKASGLEDKPFFEKMARKYGTSRIDQLNVTQAAIILEYFQENGHLHPQMREDLTDSECNGPKVKETYTRALRTVRRKILTVRASNGDKVKWALPADLPKTGLTEMIEKAKEKLIAEAAKREDSDGTV